MTWWNLLIADKTAQGWGPGLAESRVSVRASLRRLPPFSSVRRRALEAFTLIEIMIVIAIMGIAMTIGFPMVYRSFHKEPMRKAVSDLVEVCSNARAQAILKGQQVDLVFHPAERRVEVGGAGAAASSETRVAVVSTPAPSGLSVQLADDVVIEMLDINHIGEFREAEEARVRFFPNGTCDEMTLIIRAGQQQQGIVLEITTGLATVLDADGLWKLRGSGL